MCISIGSHTVVIKGMYITSSVEQRANTDTCFDPPVPEALAPPIHCIILPPSANGSIQNSFN